MFNGWFKCTIGIFQLLLLFGGITFVLGSWICRTFCGDSIDADVAKRIINKKRRTRQTTAFRIRSSMYLWLTFFGMLILKNLPFFFLQFNFIKYKNTSSQKNFTVRIIRSLNLSKPQAPILQGFCCKIYDIHCWNFPGLPPLRVPFKL